MPLIEATGTRVARMRPEGVKKSIAPERTWLSMSVSPPSWLLGKIWISRRPFDSSLIFATASVIRMVIGWVSGELLAYLWVDAAASARRVRILTVAIAVAAAAVPATKRRRVIFLVMSSLPE